MRGLGCQASMVSRSEEHTSELQSLTNLVCRLLLEKKNAQQGMETLVLNQSRPDIGLKVVKVIVPGMRHFWARFAPGRLYEVPVKMGWLTEALTEEQLNPIPMFF